MAQPVDRTTADFIEARCIKVHPVSVQGRKFDVYVDDDGDFRASVDGRRCDGERLSELIDNISRCLNESKIGLSIPVTILRHQSTRNGRVTGVTTGNTGFAITWEGGLDSEVVPFYDLGYGIQIFRRLTDEDAAELLRLDVAGRRARKEFTDFSEARLIDLRAAINLEYERQQAELLAEQQDTKPA